MPRLGNAELKGGATDGQPSRGIFWRGKSRVTLFDAVAGRATPTGFLPSNPKTTKYRDTLAISTQPVSPENHLFRLKGRAYQGDLDPYWAHEKLTENQKLPDSDLLKAIHTYVSDFYSRSFGEQGQKDFYSFDETALLCLGVMMEEMADEVLGDTGDLALTEGEAIESTERGVDANVNSERETSVTSAPTNSPMEEDEESDASKARRPKRRKIMHDADEN